MSDPKAEIDPTEPGYIGAFRLDGQAALITGAGSERGIGREIGLAYGETLFRAAVSGGVDRL